MTRPRVFVLSSISLLYLLRRSCSSWQIIAPRRPVVARPLGSKASNNIDDEFFNSPQRRSILLCPTAFLAAVTTLLPTITNAAAPPNAAPNLDFITTSTGLQYADIKTGATTSAPPKDGQLISIDYVMSTTGARYGSKIYSTQDAGAPYRWTLGDGSTIPGLEEAVRGMNPGGIRRVIIPSKLAYQSIPSLTISKFYSFVA
jgi:hypothetical protein